MATELLLVSSIVSISQTSKLLGTTEQVTPLYCLVGFLFG